MEYQGKTYYYEKNLQGDIIGLFDDGKNSVVQYQYDSWGKLLNTTGTLSSTVGTINPLRYRGYYYDVETGFYYLQSRYYDAEIGRFINADSTDTLGVYANPLSDNLYSYCFSNPVNYYDPDGRFAISLSIIGGAALAKLIIGAFVVVAAAVILSDPAVQKGLSQTITALGSGIKTACEALAKAIEDVYKKAKTRAKNNNYANHHIVAKTAAGAKEARGYLAHKNVRIGIDRSLNLVRIKQNLHCHLHTAAYYTAVNNLLKPANGSCSKTVAVLSFIRATLLAVSAQTP